MNVSRHLVIQALLKLRQEVDPHGDLILANRHTVGWQTMTQLEWDTARFTIHLRQCQTHSHAVASLCESCMAQRERAVSLYKGPFLAGLSLPDAPQFEQWLTQQQEKYHRQVMDALVTLTTYHEQRAELAQAIQYAEQQLAFEPWREEAHYQLMRLLLYKGQRSSAIAQYRTCARTLADELGVGPSAKTIALFKLIQTSNEEPPHNLPTEATPFVGREVEIARLTSWLAGQQRRLVTLIGPGGMGKSRLARAVAKRQLGRPLEDALRNATSYSFFTHGVYWVSLVGVEKAVPLVPTLAKAVGLQLKHMTNASTRSAQQQLLDFLRKRRLLLVLDNFEQLLVSEEARAATAVLNTILHNAPDVQLLVTSRERLQLPQEQLYQLRGLSYPKTAVDTATEYAAVSLFTQTAKRIQPEFQLDQKEQPAVAHICRVFQGMPLALELAASSLNILSPTDLVTELAHSLDHLATTMRHIPERHRSIRAAFETSWQHLNASEQMVWQKVSIFGGGFDRAAAQAVAGASLPVLTSLANKSFIRFHHDSQRYEIHELMRQFGTEKLLQSANQARRVGQFHGFYFAGKLQQWSLEFKGAQQESALREMAANSKNMYTAWHWAVQHKHLESLAQASDGPGLLYQAQGRYLEGAELYQTACVMLRTVPLDVAERSNLLIKALSWQGLFRFYLGQTAAATTLFRGQFAAAQSNFEERLAILNDLGVQPNIAVTEIWLGIAHFNLGLYHKAENNVRKSLSLISATNIWATAHAKMLLAYTQLALGKREEARTALNSSIALFQQLDQRDELSQAQAWLSYVELAEGKFQAAQNRLSNCLGTALEIRTVLPVMIALPAIVGLLVVYEELELAIEIQAMAQQMPGLANSAAFADLVGQPYKTAAELLPAEVVAAAQKRGQQRELWETATALSMYFADKSQSKRD